MIKSCALMFLWMVPKLELLRYGVWYRDFWYGTIRDVAPYRMVRYGTGTGTGTVCYRTVLYAVIRELSDASMLASDKLPSNFQLHQS